MQYMHLAWNGIKDTLWYCYGFYPGILGPKIDRWKQLNLLGPGQPALKPVKVEYTTGGNFTKAASLPEKMCCGNAIVIGKGSEQTIYLSGGLQ